MLDAEGNEIVEEIQEGEVVEEQLDDEGNPLVPVEEPWMKVEEEEVDDQQSSDPSKQVPVRKFVKLKKDLRGKISERDEEIERLRQENEALKNGPRKTEIKPLVRPNVDDFSTDQDYQDALDKYYDDRAAETFQRTQQQEQQKSRVINAQKAISQAVDSHYERAGKLLEESGIKPDLYKNADLAVRQAVDQVLPKSGDAVVDQIISILDEGSEKVMYYLGRNKAALDKFQNLLSVDPTGMKAAVYLGQEKQRLAQPKKLKSNAPPPAPNVNGDVNGSKNGVALKRAYDAAHKKNNTQAAYNAKRDAKAAGIDVSKW